MTTKSFLNHFSFLVLAGITLITQTSLAQDYDLPPAQKSACKYSLNIPTQRYSKPVNLALSELSEHLENILEEKGYRAVSKNDPDTLLFKTHFLNGFKQSLLEYLFYGIPMSSSRHHVIYLKMDKMPDSDALVAYRYSNKKSATVAEIRSFLEKHLPACE